VGTQTGKPEDGYHSISRVGVEALKKPKIKSDT